MRWASPSELRNVLMCGNASCWMYTHTHPGLGLCAWASTAESCSMRCVTVPVAGCTCTHTHTYRHTQIPTHTTTQQRLTDEGGAQGFPGLDSPGLGLLVPPAHSRGPDAAQSDAPLRTYEQPASCGRCVSNVFTGVQQSLSSQAVEGKLRLLPPSTAADGAW